MAKSIEDLPRGPVGSPWASRLIIHGFKYLPNLDVPMGTILEVSGDNETGKSLLLKTLQRCVYKDHDPDLIADGYDEATSTLEFIDEQDVTFWVKTITKPTKTIREVGASDGRAIDGAVETWLKNLSNVFLMDPLALLSADKKERERFLKQALPVVFTGEEISRITGVPATDCDLTKFGDILAGAEAERTRLNKIASDTDGAINRLAPAILESTEQVNYAERAHFISQEQRTLENELSDKKNQLKLLENQEISDIDKQLQKDLQALRDKAQADKDAVRDLRKLKEGELTMQYAPLIAEKQTAYGEAQAKSIEQTKQKGMREQLDKLRLELKTQRRAATAAQTVVEKLSQLQSEKWKSLPLKGVEYRNGDIFVDGKNIDEQVNTAKIYTTLLKIATFAYRPGMLPLIITHRTESLGRKNREWFYAAVREAGFQLACERMIEDAPLTLKVLDDPTEPPRWKMSTDEEREPQPLRLEY